MATRATIKIEGFTIAKIYKHWDGYPEAMTDWLKSFNADFAVNRGNDPSYKFAQLLRSSASDAEKFQLDASRYTGWGVVAINANCGEEYEYTLRTNGEVIYCEKNEQ